MSHTYAILGVSPATYREIRTKIEDADYHHAFHGDVIDMHGIALSEEPATEPPTPTATVESLRVDLAHHLNERNDPCQDRGVNWPCDVARALLGLPDEAGYEDGDIV